MAVLIVATAAMLMIAIAFLIAASILRRANNRKAAHWTQLETNWSVTIEYIARALAGADTLHHNVAPGQQLTLLDYLYKSTVSDARPERRRLYAQLARPYLPRLETRVHDGDVWQRARAIRTLAELGDANQGAIIIKALDDPAPHVAMTAARAYTRLRLGSIEPLLERVERYQAWDRRLLRLTLTSLGVSAAPALHARFADAHHPPRTRAVCADALASLKYGDANDTAVAVLLIETDVDLRAAALRVIRAPVSDAQRLVVRGLCDDQDPVVRAQAVACLARIGNVSDVQPLEAALADLSSWVVLNATKGLTTLGHTPAQLEAKILAGGSREWE